MKKVFLLTLMVVFVLASTSVYAQEKYALGSSNIALKVDYIKFTDDAFADVDLEDGVYVGLEIYHALMPNLYLGLEGGWAGTEGDDDANIGGERVDIETDTTLVPIELNLKFAGEIVPNLVVGVGAGASYSYFEIDADIGDINADEDDWVFGGQVFAEVTYKIGSFFIGIDGKYHFTEDIEIGDGDIETDTNANNWRVGGHVGLMF
ncbi:MAG: outer membrane beta-barrel protein [Nitrospirota bacterium]